MSFISAGEFYNEECDRVISKQTYTDGEFKLI